MACDRKVDVPSGSKHAMMSVEFSANSLNRCSLSASAISAFLRSELSSTVPNIATTSPSELNSQAPRPSTWRISPDGRTTREMEVAETPARTSSRLALAAARHLAFSLAGRGRRTGDCRDKRGRGAGGLERSAARGSGDAVGRRAISASHRDPRMWTRSAARRWCLTSQALPLAVDALGVIGSPQT